MPGLIRQQQTDITKLQREIEQLQTLLDSEYDSRLSTCLDDAGDPHLGNVLLLRLAGFLSIKVLHEEKSESRFDTPRLRARGTRTRRFAARYSALPLSL